MKLPGPNNTRQNRRQLRLTWLSLNRVRPDTDYANCHWSPAGRTAGPTYYSRSVEKPPNADCQPLRPSRYQDVSGSVPESVTSQGGRGGPPLRVVFPQGCPQVTETVPLISRIITARTPRNTSKTAIDNYQKTQPNTQTDTKIINGCRSLITSIPCRYEKTLTVVEHLRAWLTP